MKTLETSRLLLREWKLSDSKDLFEYAQSDLVGPNAGWPPHENEEKSKEIIKDFIASKCIYAIELKETGKVIGGIGIHERQPDSALKDLNQRELGYVLNPAYWGRGIVPEAVNRLIQFGFEDLNLDIIWCGHYKENIKSKRVNEKCGFKYHMKKEETLTLLDNKKVETWYYKIEKNAYKTATII
jgi:RimJ/RimL family protein N-acetyltransferase